MLHEKETFKILNMLDYNIFKLKNYYFNISKLIPYFVRIITGDSGNPT